MTLRANVNSSEHCQLPVKPFCRLNIINTATTSSISLTALLLYKIKGSWSLCGQFRITRGEFACNRYVIFVAHRYHKSLMTAQKETTLAVVTPESESWERFTS